MEISAGNEVVTAEQLDSISSEPMQAQPPPSGKLRKTAFKFFGSRKSICVLPSFFGGRGKGQGKGSSKSGVTKSRTHDGVSRGCWEEAVVKGNGDVLVGDFEFRSQRDSEGGDSQKTPEALKSQSVPWQRRSLRSLFSSIRRHKKSRNVEAEKSESLEMSPSACFVPVAQVAVGDDRLGNVSEPDVPVSVNGSEHVISAVTSTECMMTGALVPERRRSECPGEENVSDVEDEEGGQRRGQLSTYRQPLCAESEMARLSEQKVDEPDNDQPAISSSSDHMSLIFADVSSLKSFDSLTGCGDIIADQDDDSVAESSVSGERGSRNGGKRSSCFVTYQGGGEEMATPDELEGDYLQSLWETEVGKEVCYMPTGQSDSPLLTPDQPVSSLHTTSNSSNTTGSPLGVTETTLTTGDLLTPQSDKQESVPNSDEGYYDSTTPGADEEARDLARADRLPRDSYSGDALYELYEPDDRLLSPPLPPGDPHSFLGVPLQGAEENPAYSLKGTTETEEDRLGKIQQALLARDLQSLRSPSADMLLFNTGCFHAEANLSAETCKLGTKDESLSPRGKRTPHALEEPLPSHAGFGHKMPDSPTYSSKTPSPLQEAGLYLEPEQRHANAPPCSQSQEELMVCFSQALVDFTKTSRLYRNSTESLDGSESSSPFGQNLQALPAIVTFDVVDMDNESECEQRTELEVEEEDLASPFEVFEDESCYLQKDAFAECDERMLDPYEQSLLLDGAWGIASLPRHLSLGRACQPAPAPPALNRRSRSLDTDSLEVHATEPNAKRAGSLHRRKTGRSPEAAARGEVRRQSRAQGRTRGSPSDPKHAPVNASAMETPSRPSHLPLRPGRGPAQPMLSGGSTATGGFLGSNRADGGEAFYSRGYHATSSAQPKTHPVGVTQGVPNPRSYAVGSASAWGSSDGQQEFYRSGKKAMEAGTVFGSTQMQRVVTRPLSRTPPDTQTWVP
ncbi:APC membrane recruitment protein 1 [Denticeps clupeoides]|uniref:APC membrane recruitment protein 1 n=1 Tax=Denticeps clupeoides TaxID=299321 RepID=A0AAY4EKM2_9TELE|nr:APC membrane recruitment protein 1 [Denticeps clupeoides]XP_028839629.1 APC membrane recruitment protein 1 [Denticeps clupeoides]